MVPTGVCVMDDVWVSVDELKQALLPFFDSGVSHASAMGKSVNRLK